MIERKGIVIYFQNKKVLKTIEKYNINIVYVNEAGKYLTGYCDIKDFPLIKKELKNHKLIRKVDESYVEMPEIGL
ncbi:MAG TPA: DUF2129 domain-containing protein [Bacillota bacterium]|nr:DUF2129 domain-containing protein [Bacillota bacterium]